MKVLKLLAGSKLVLVNFLFFALTTLISSCGGPPSEPYFKYVLSGVVTNNQGSPLSGISVQFYEHTGGCAYLPNLITEVLTDRSGLWKIDYDFPIASGKFGLERFGLEINSEFKIDSESKNTHYNSDYNTDIISLDLNKTEDGGCDFYCGKYEQHDVAAVIYPYTEAIFKLVPSMLCK